MKTDNVFLIVCGVLTFVVLLNAGLVFGLLRGQNRERFEVIGKAIGAAQNPWGAVDEQYNQLRARVAELEDAAIEEEPDGS